MNCQSPPLRRKRRRLIGAALLLLLVAGAATMSQVTAADRPQPHATPADDTAPLYLPMIQRQATVTPIPTATQMSTATPPPTPNPRTWDSRLEQRHASLIEATVQPQQGYWRLVRAQWYDESEAGGRHHILVDVLDAAGARLVDVPIRVYWNGGEAILHTQAKPGEPYAADFAMFSIAPSYGAAPNNGAPTDILWGMGLGSIELPFHTIHSSYGLVWQWTVAGGEMPPTATATPTPTPTPEVTATVTATAPATSTPPSALPTRQWDPRLDQRGVTLTAAQVAPGEGYWRLVRGAWYDEMESGGRHHIFIDLLDANGQRITERPVRFYWNGGEVFTQTQAKPGELYAADFGMSSPGPSFGAVPADGAPADQLWGMGLGSIEQPYYAIKTSYGFVWQWTIQPEPGQDANLQAASVNFDSRRMNR